MTWFFLALSLAFFCVRDFRPVLEAPVALLLPEIWTGEYGASEWSRYIAMELDQRTWQVGLINLGTGRILDRLFTLQRYTTPAGFRQMARNAEQTGDTEFMAFAALHLPAREMREDILRLTDHAIAVNPKLTWLIYFVVPRLMPESGSAPPPADLLARVDTLRAWDPDNAVPHILHAYLVRSWGGQIGKGAASNPSQVGRVLAQHLEWQKEMETAFALPRYDPYVVQRTELDRRVMIKQGWDNPVVVVSALWYWTPGTTFTYDYARLLVGDMGKDAEAEGRTEDALHDYRLAARFGERLRLQGRTLTDEIEGLAIQRTAYERLVPALNKAGKADEAAAVEFAQKQTLDEIDRRFQNPRERTSNHTWAVLLASVVGTTVWVFLFLSLVSILYVNAKLLIRRDKKGRLYQVMTVLENYAPLVLFISCLALGLIYAPFAQNFSSYIAPKEPQVSWELLQNNSYPMLQILGRTDLPIQNPYHGFMTYALAIGGLMVIIAIVRSRLTARRKPT
jgi:hypothetical protein